MIHLKLDLIAIYNIDKLLFDCRIIIVGGGLMLGLDFGVWIYEFLEDFDQSLQPLNKSTIKVTLFFFLDRIEIDESYSTIIRLWFVVDANENAASFDIVGPVASPFHMIFQIN